MKPTITELNYRKLSTKLHHSRLEGRDENPETEAIRDEMDLLWQSMTDEEHTRCRQNETYHRFLEQYAIFLKMNPGGMFATFMYTVRSHLRGKLHMKWWKKYQGGWYSAQYIRNKDKKVTYRRHPDGSLNHEITGFLIEDLNDQADWIDSTMKTLIQGRAYNANYKMHCPEISVALETLIKALMEKGI